MSTVAIRIGHKGPGTGAAFGNRDEVSLATAYGREVERAILGSGRRVLWLPSSSTGYAHELVNVVNPDPDVVLYLQLHINSATGITDRNDHGMIFYDHRSKAGPVLARAWCEAMEPAWPQHWRVESDDPAGAYPRVHPCIRAAHPVALLLEPWFIQVARNEIDAGRAIGAGLVAALKSWSLA